MSKLIPYNKNFIKIKPYVPGSLKAKKIRFPLIKLSSNGLSSFSKPIQKKINNVNVKLSQYPMGKQKLRNKISKI